MKHPHADNFINSRISLVDLPDLTNDTLSELGITVMDNQLAIIRVDKSWIAGSSFSIIYTGLCECNGLCRSQTTFGNPE